MKINKKILIGFLSLAFLFTASVAFASLSFSSDTITSSGVLNLTPTGQRLGVNGQMLVGGISTPVFGDGGGSYNNLLVQSLEGDDSAAIGITGQSDGYAYTELNFNYTAQPGDVRLYTGAPATAGATYNMFSLWGELVDTTDPQSFDGAIYLSFQADNDPIHFNARGDVAIGAATADYGSGFPIPLAGNLFIDGQSGAVTGKSTFTGTGVIIPEVAFDSLPASPVIGQIANVSNSNTNTWGANVAGGGSNHVQVRWNGSNWTVTGK